jgi:hypothetical protein
LQRLEIYPTTAAATSGDLDFYIVARVYESVWGAASSTGVGTFSLSGETNSDGTMTWKCVPGDGPGSEAAILTQYLPANCRG